MSTTGQKGAPVLTNHVDARRAWTVDKGTLLTERKRALHPPILGKFHVYSQVV